MARQRRPLSAEAAPRAALSATARRQAAAEELTGTHPELPEMLHLAGRCLARKAELLTEAGEDAAAAVEYERALSHLRASTDRMPGVLQPLTTCARTLGALARLRAREGEKEEAAEEEVVDHQPRRSRQNPS